MKTSPDTTIDVARPTSNADHVWPEDVSTVGLVAPSGGHDAVADAHAHLDPSVTAIEHRVAVIGPRVVMNIMHALDRLALDLTLLVRGGGPSTVLAPFDDALVLVAIERQSTRSSQASPTPATTQQPTAAFTHRVPHQQPQYSSKEHAMTEPADRTAGSSPYACVFAQHVRGFLP